MPLPHVSMASASTPGQRPAGSSPHRYGDAPVLAAGAEAAGFDAFWVSEHHAYDDGYLPSPLPVLAACAAVTTDITLGTGLVLAPLYDPVRLATDAAVVDQLCGGRLVLGLGLGYVDEEHRAFSVDRRTRARRLEETIEVLRLAWTGERWARSAGSTVWCSGWQACLRSTSSFGRSPRGRRLGAAESDRCARRGSPSPDQPALMGIAGGMRSPHWATS